VVAVAAFAALQVIARSQRRRWSAYADWRTWPPGYDPWADGGDPVAGQHEGSAYRPGFGFLPGHGRGAEPGQGPAAEPGLGRGAEPGPGRDAPVPRSVRDGGRQRSFTA